MEDLIGYEDVQQPILMGLVGMLKANDDGSSSSGNETSSIHKPLQGKYHRGLYVTDPATPSLLV